MFPLEQRMLYSGFARAFGSFSWPGSEESSVLALLNPFLCVLRWGVPAECRIAWKSALMAECHIWGRCWWKGLLCPAKDLTSELCPPLLEGSKAVHPPRHTESICQGDLHSRAFKRCKTFLSVKRKWKPLYQDPETSSQCCFLPCCPLRHNYNSLCCPL